MVKLTQHREMKAKEWYIKSLQHKMAQPKCPNKEQIEATILKLQS